MRHSVKKYKNAEFNKIQGELLPRVRPIAWFELQAKYGCELSDDPECDYFLPHKVLNDDLGLGAVLDSDGSVKFVSNQDLNEWGINIDQLINTAVQNLQNLDVGFQEFSPGVWVSDWQHTDNASLMFHNRAIKSLQVKGDLVAFIPHRSYLIVTGSKDIEGLESALKIVDELIDDEHSLTSFSYILQDGNWQVFVPEKNHPLKGEIEVRQAQSVEFYQELLNQD